MVELICEELTYEALQNYFLISYACISDHAEANPHFIMFFFFEGRHTQ